MKAQVRNVLLLSLGMSLFVGCGGQQSDAEVSPTDDGNPSSIAIPEEYLGQDDSSPEGGEGGVGSMQACCYIKCSDNVWRGPYRNVKKGNCVNFAKYECPRIRQTFVAGKWDNC